MGARLSVLLSLVILVHVGGLPRVWGTTGATLVMRGGPVEDGEPGPASCSCLGGNLSRCDFAQYFGTAEGHNQKIERINDGGYGDSSAYIMVAPGPSTNLNYLGIYFTDGLHEISSIALGYDNTGREGGRFEGARTVQYTVNDLGFINDFNDPADVDAIVNSVTWVEAAVLDDHLDLNACGPCAEYPNRGSRHQYTFDVPFMARAVRVLGKPQNGFDELELGNPLVMGPCSTGASLLGVGPKAAAGETSPDCDGGNLSRCPGSKFFGTAEGHNQPIDLINDGGYNGGSTYIALDPGPTTGLVYLGISFPEETEISEVAISRDNTGVEATRTEGPYTVQITTDNIHTTIGSGSDPDAVDIAVSTATWTTVASLEGHLPFDPESSGLRRNYLLDDGPFTVRAVRILTLPNNAFDELEITGTGKGVRLVMTGGPDERGEAAGVSSSCESGNLSRCEFAQYFGTAEGHNQTIERINDGNYGDASAYIMVDPGPTTGLNYLGMYFTDGLHEISSIALGYDNTGREGGRAEGVYIVEYTMDDLIGITDFNDPADVDAVVDTAVWTEAGILDKHLTLSPCGPCDDFPNRGSRHQYEFIAPITARAVRVLSQAQNGFDELELGNPLPSGPEASGVELIQIGPVVDPDSGGMSPDCSDGNLSRCSGNKFFGTAEGHNHKIDRINDGGYGDPSAYITVDPGPESGLNYLGIAFPRATVISELAISRDNTGTEATRTDGPYTVEITTDNIHSAIGDGLDPAVVDAAVTDAGWTEVAILKAHLPFDSVTSGLRHHYAFLDADGERISYPVRAVRILTLPQNAFDEFEVGDPLPEPPPPDSRPGPTGLTASVSEDATTILLDWNNDVQTVDGYNVYRSEARGGPYTQLNDELLTESSYGDTTLNGRILNHYVVTSEGPAGTFRDGLGQSVPFHAGESDFSSPTAARLSNPHLEAGPQIDGLEFWLDASDIDANVDTENLDQLELVTEWREIMAGHRFREKSAAAQPVMETILVGNDEFPAVFFDGQQHLTTLDVNDGAEPFPMTDVPFLQSSQGAIVCIYANSNPGQGTMLSAGGRIAQDDPNRGFVTFGVRNNFFALMTNGRAWGLVPNVPGAVGVGDQMNPARWGYDSVINDGEFHFSVLNADSEKWEFFNGGAGAMEGPLRTETQDGDAHQPNHSEITEANAGLWFGEVNPYEHMTLGTLSVRGDDFGNGRDLIGSIAEILIFDHPLDSSERARLNSYVKNKYGLVGACCLPEGTCTSGISEDCESQGGTYQGNNTFCDPEGCAITITGACCFTDGTCETLLEADCAAREGTYKGNETTCEAESCPVTVTGACCFRDGTCETLLEADCAAREGTYKGNETTCEAESCPITITGGCCLGDGSCELLLETDCAARDGKYQGDDVACAPSLCATSFRRGDCDHSGAVDFNDAIYHLRFLFLGENEDAVSLCLDACDSDDSGDDDFTDDINTLQFLFLGSGVIPDPGPMDTEHPCGIDPTEGGDDVLDCVSYEPVIDCP